MSELLLNDLMNREREENQTVPSGALSEGEINDLAERMSQARQNDTKSKEDAEVDNVAWTSEDSLASAQRFFSSAALGWGDEVGIWTAAVIAAAPVVGTYARYGLDTTVREQYDKLKAEYDQKQAEFEQRQPEAAMAAEVGGAIASPVNVLRAPVAATKLGQAATTGGRVAAESAVYGAGEAKQGERLEGAVKGAGAGLVGYGVLRSGLGLGGKTVQSFTRRRVEGDLVDDAGDFVPITLAASKPDGAEGLVHTFYRDVVAPSFGGKGTIRGQEERIVGKAEDWIKAQVEIAKNMDANLKVKIQEQKDALGDAMSALRTDAANQTKLKRTETASTLVPLQEKLRLLKSGKADEIAAKATSDVKRLLNARRFEFRNQAFSRAMPATASVADIQRVLSVEDIGQRMRALDELWSSKGYSMIKGKKIRFKKNEFEQALVKGISSDPVFKTLIMDLPGFQKNIQNAMRNVQQFKDASGRIDGDVVAAIRSHLGSIAANAGDPLLRKSYYMAQGKIDDIINNQLTDVQKLDFAKESGNWKSTVVLRDAVEGVRKDSAKRGVFDESDWIRAASDNNNLDKRYGTGPLVKQAHVLEENLRAAEKSIAKRATNLAKARAKMVEDTMKQHSAKLKQQLERINNELAAKKAKLRSNPEFAEDIAKATRLKEAKQMEIDQLKSQLDDLKRLRSPQNPTWYHTLAASSILGAAGKTAFKGAALLTGGALGKAMASPSMQRFVAGQTAPQMAAQRVIGPRAEELARGAEILSRSVGRTGLLTGG